MSHLRLEALKVFKKLHRTRKAVFQGDERAINEARKRINNEFRKNRNVEDPAEIEKLIKIAKDVDVELRTNIIQAVQKKPGVFEIRVTPDTPFFDNIPFQEDAVFPEFKGPKCRPKKS